MAIHTSLGRLLLVILFCAFVGSAHQSTPSSQTSDGRIYIDVVVTPKSGSPVAGLQQQDFTLLDNKAPLPIASFQAVTSREAPLEVVIVIDAVNAVPTVVDFERIAIDKFLHTEGGRLSYPVALKVFTDSGMRNLADFSSDGDALSAKLKQENIGLRINGRSEGFYGAVDRLQLSVSAVSNLAVSLAADQRRKIILWVSPGWPFLAGANAQMDSKQQNDVFASVVALSTQLQHSHATLYSIDPRGAGESPSSASYYEVYLKGISKPGQAQIGDLALQVLAVQSGGLSINSMNDVAAILQDCLTKAAPYYEISFIPAHAEKPNEYHHIEIKLDKPGLTARTRQGYYAQP